MSEPETVEPALVLRRMLGGYQVAQAIHVAAALGIADLLGDAVRPSDELAAATESDGRALYRLLRALASVGVLREHEGRRFGLTPLGAYLRTDSPDSLAGWAAFIGRPYYWQAWSSLLDSVKTGQNAFRLVHGESVWEYRAQHPDEAEIFDRAMLTLSRRAARSLIERYPFERFGSVVDVGGGHGGLLAALLAAHPQLRGVLFDLPHVIATAGPNLAAAGVDGRCRLEAGSFFDAVPAGADAYLLKWILHDWEDEEAIAILRTTAAAAGGTGVVLVIEQLVGPPNESPDVKLFDLNMLVGPGGRERTLAEYEALLDAAGLRLRQATAAGLGLSVLEAAQA